MHVQTGLVECRGIQLRDCGRRVQRGRAVDVAQRHQRRCGAVRWPLPVSVVSDVPLSPLSIRPEALSSMLAVLVTYSATLVSLSTAAATVQSTLQTQIYQVGMATAISALCDGTVAHPRCSCRATP